MKENGYAKGGKPFWIMYIRRNCAEGAKNFGSPSSTLKKFWSPPLWSTEKKCGPPLTTPENSGPNRHPPPAKDW